MVSHRSVRFDGHRLCGSGDMVLLAVEGQYSTSSRFNSPLLFISKTHGILWSHTRNFTIKRTLTKTFVKVSNEKKRSQPHALLVTNDEILVKQSFASPLLKHRQEGSNKKDEKNKPTKQAIAKFFVLHAKTNTKQMQGAIVACDIIARKIQFS